MRFGHLPLGFLLALTAGPLNAADDPALKSDKSNLLRESGESISWASQAADQSLKVADAEAAREAAFLRAAGEKALRDGDLKNALDLAEKSISIDSKSPKGFEFKSRVLCRMHRYMDAEKTGREALVLDPGDLDSLYTFAWPLLHQKAYDTALEVANLAVTQAPNTPWGYVLRAFAHEGAGKSELKLESLQHAVKLDPKFGEHFKRASAGTRLFQPGKTRLDEMQRALPPTGFEIPTRPLLILLGIFLGAGSIFAALRFGPRMRGRFSRRGSASVPSAQPHKTLAGKYRLGDLISRGGLGDVYLGEDLSAKHPVAIRSLVESVQRMDAQRRKSMIMGVRAAASLTHQGIVKVYEVLDLPEGVFIVFEHIEGRTLDNVLTKLGRLPLEKVKKVLSPVCAAIEFAHESNLVHQDLKPSNIMIDRGGNAKVMDFGISRGTPGYMAPELEQGNVSPAVDIYSLGAIFYEMITGKRVGKDGSRESISEKIPGHTVAMQELADRAMGWDPIHRLPSALDFKMLLDVIDES